MISQPTQPARDFVGYGRTPPRAPWPGGARIALSVVLNYEEGSEQTAADGDANGEDIGEVVRPVGPGERSLAVESMFQYGSRAGVWRLLAIFDREAVPVTVFACALAIERNDELAAYLASHEQHEVCCHGYRWEKVALLDAETERQHLRLAVDALHRAVGRRPRGWYCRYGPSLRTRRLLVEVGGFEYDSDSYADDLPYMVEVDGQQWCVVPYALDTNDMKFWGQPSFGTAQDFFTYLKDGFDYLYREGADRPKMMSVGLHCRIAGRPARAAAVERFIQYAKAHTGVWFARRVDIARAWVAAARAGAPESPLLQTHTPESRLLDH
jgi:peptidoglycan/xylan/chitin deacetylase (PgdA/CDA1 family)